MADASAGFADGHSDSGLRSFFDSLPEAVVMLDEAGLIVTINIRAQTLFGYSAYELRGQQPSVLTDTAVFDATPSDADRTGRRKDGTTFPFQASLSPIHVLKRSFSALVVNDLTERREIEKALRVSEEKYRDLLEGASDVVYTHDMQGNFTWVNETGIQLYGYTQAEILRMNIAQIVDPEDLPRALARMAEKAAGADTAPYTVRTCAKDRTCIWVEVATRLVRDDHGTPLCVQGIARDVSARVRAEDALRRTNEFRDRVMESTRNGIAALDLQGHLTLVNRRATEMTGYAAEEMIGTSLAVFIADEDRAPLAAAFASAFADGSSIVDYQAQLLRKDGVRITALINAGPLVDDGKVVGFAGTAEDITDRIRALESIRESEQRYRQMFEGHSAVSLLLDPDTRCIVDANHAAGEFYGYSRDELVGMDIARINTLPPGDISAEMHKAVGGDQFIFRFQHRLASGDLRDVEVRAAPVDIAGRRLLFSIIQDITQRNQAEALLTAQRQLLEMVAIGAPIDDVLTAITATVEQHAPGAFCSVLTVSDDGTELQGACSPSMPAGYDEAVAHVPIGPNEGSCGTAAYRGEPVIVVDVQTDPLWEKYRHAADALGLRACWSTPITSSAGIVLGTFAVYHHEPHEPTARERELTQIATHVAGIAFERQRAEEAVRERAGELEQTYEQLVGAHAELEDSQARLKEKSALLEQALASERERARRDPLTGALNHAALTDVMREHIADPDERLLAIAMVDVDGLKAANDTYGHQTGDAVLLSVARALDRGGAIIGRYGGDEFVAVLPGADRAAAERYRDAVMAALAAQELTDPESGARISVVLSMGLAIYPEEAQAVDDLIKLSDSAMYAQRRQRAAIAGAGVSRMLGSDRAAKMIGEIVPFLTTPGDLEEKLRLVAMRLSIGAGYDAVNFALFGPEPGDPVISNSFSEAQRELVEQWDAAPRTQSEAHPMRLLLERTRRPVLVDNVPDSDLVNEDQKRLLAAAGILSGLVAPMIWQGAVVGSLTVGSKRRAAFGPRDAQFVGAVATQVSSIVRTAALVDELQEASTQLLQAHTETVMMLAGAAEAHDHTTGRHLQRVHSLTEAIALELGHDEEAAKEIGLAAVLHDIGKIRVPDYVLTSAESLGDNEWTLMKQHTVWGAQFLIARRGFELASQVARSHHERWDGTGYPDGLAGAEIPEAATITSVADSLDAMTNDRPYRAGRPIIDAVQEVQAWSGRQFSPRVVEALMRLYERGDLHQYLDDHPAHAHDSDADRAA